MRLMTAGVFNGGEAKRNNQNMQAAGGNGTRPFKRQVRQSRFNASCKAAMLSDTITATMHAHATMSHGPHIR